MCKDRTLMCMLKGRNRTTGQVIRLNLILDITHYVTYSMFHTV